eukprot:scaffold4840_cov115-Isochrysis_galbana.AAC.9
MQWLPPNVRADYYGLREQWIDNNLTYLDALLLEILPGQGRQLHARHLARVPLQAYVPPRRVPPLPL